MPLKCGQMDPDDFNSPQARHRAYEERVGVKATLQVAIENYLLYNKVEDLIKLVAALL